MYPRPQSPSLRGFRGLALAAAALALPVLPCSAGAQTGSPWTRAIEETRQTSVSQSTLQTAYHSAGHACPANSAGPIALVSGGIPPLYPARIDLVVSDSTGGPYVRNVRLPFDADSLAVRIVGARCHGLRPVRLLLAAGSDTLLYTLQHKDQPTYEYLRARDPRRGWQVPVWNAASMALAAAAAEGTARTRASASPARRSSAAERGYYRGPRGGCYTYTSGGNKRYVDRSYCN